MTVKDFKKVLEKYDEDDEVIFFGMYWMSVLYHCMKDNYILKVKNDKR